MGSTFFGLTFKTAPQIRKNLFTQIHEIVFHGQGGYTWESIYNMPIWLRKYTYKQIKDHYNKKPAQNFLGNIKNLINSEGKIKTPNFIGKTNYK